jgi:hypothetical protein
MVELLLRSLELLLRWLKLLLEINGTLTKVSIMIIKDGGLTLILVGLILLPKL